MSSFNQRPSAQTIALTGPNNQILFGGFGAGSGNASTGSAFISTLSVTNPAQASVLTVPDPGVAACNVALAISPVTAIGGITTLKTSDSGKVFSLTATGGGYVISLPAPTAAAGLNYRFFVAANAAGAITISSTAANMRFRGLLNIAAGCTGVDSASCTSVLITCNSASAVGDWVEITSDGTNYFAYGMAAIAGGFTTA